MPKSKRRLKLISLTVTSRFLEEFDEAIQPYYSGRGEAVRDAMRQFLELLREKGLTS